ncbi:MAG TPA: FAD/NAD(P)-binding oxidoreductase [Cellvibrio sp.]|nr:FAD/NAD(P)-binding oxidoreductase [Cellvibrio sp.]
MASIVFIGAGLGGMAGAYEMHDAVGDKHKVIVINERESFQFVPSNPWLAVGWREAEQISFPIRPYLEKKGIEFIAKRVDEIDPIAKKVTLNDSTQVDYDYLVISTGPRLAFEEVPGAGPHGGFTQSICTLDHAQQAHEDFKKLLENPGPVVIGAMPGASCFGPAYEYAFILDTALSRAGIRHRVPMTFVTSEPYIGHLGLAGVGDSKGMMESELRKRHINWVTNAKTTRVEAGKLFADELNAQGEMIKQHELPFVHSMMLPSFKGVEAVANVEGLCNPRGFVHIDRHQRSTKYPTIFSAGVCVAIPPIEVTPVPTGAPKTGYMIESMMTALVHNIAAELNDQEPDFEGSWSAFCLADMGDTGAAFIAVPQLPPRNIMWYKQGKWAHLGKIAFEKYFIAKMKSGVSEPFYEKWMLDAIGLRRLDKKMHHY